MNVDERTAERAFYCEVRMTKFFFLFDFLNVLSLLLLKGL